MRSYLESAGNRVLVPRISPTASVATRAQELKTYLHRELGQTPVHIFGHSLGGLDARYMISRLGMDRQVLSLTSLGTPHQGTAFADWGVRRFSRFFRPLFRAAGVPDEAFYDLMTETCQRFNEQVPDAPNVRYQSVAGVCEQAWLGAGWRLSARIVTASEGSNDGIVSLASARWGSQITIWPGDHLNLVNWPNRRAIRQGIHLDRGEDYARLVQSLAEQGF